MRHVLVERAEVTLAAKDLAKEYAGTPVLRDITLDVHVAESLAVMGPSGSGKSTLLKCLAGILRPSRGSVTFDGAALEELDAEERSAIRLRRFGFVYQDGQLLPELDVRENAALLLLLNGVKRRTALEQAQASLDRLGVGRLADRRLNQISGGEAQRVAIARSLSSEPAVLFADEPTGSLDATTGGEVIGALLEAIEEQGTTVILITHDQTVAARADRLVFLHDGRLEPAEAHAVIP